MRKFMLIILLMWFGAQIKSQTTSTSLLPSEFIMAKYEILIDNSDINAQVSVGEMVPEEMAAYRYIIQYGNNVIITITDPGRSIAYLPVTISKIDYGKREIANQMFLRHVKKYYAKADTLNFSIEKKIGSFEPLCTGGVIPIPCDSILLSIQKSGKQYQVSFDESLENIKSRDLFYPDVKFLPRKIIPKSSKEGVWTLVDFTIGKESIDLVLQNFTYKDYELISDSEIETAKNLYPIEQTKSYLPSKSE